MFRTRTPLGQREERDFRDWYKAYSLRNRLHPNPDHPLHKYDWRGWWVAQQRNPVKYAPIVDPVDKWQHGPSEFKDNDHPNRFVDGVDTKTGSKRAKESPDAASNYKKMFEPRLDRRSQMLDPGSVVGDSEFRAAQNTGPLQGLLPPQGPLPPQTWLNQGPLPTQGPPHSGAASPLARLLSLGGPL